MSEIKTSYQIIDFMEKQEVDFCKAETMREQQHINIQQIQFGKKKWISFDEHKQIKESTATMSIYENCKVIFWRWYYFLFTKHGTGGYTGNKLKYLCNINETKDTLK